MRNIRNARTSSEMPAPKLLIPKTSLKYIVSAVPRIRATIAGFIPPITAFTPLYLRK